MKALIPRGKRDSFAAEVFGVIGGEQRGYFSKAVVSAAMERRTSVPDCTHIYVGVDPASHGKSDMGLCAITTNENGLVVIVGVGAINVARCEMSALSAVIKQFAGRLRAQYPRAELVPIIEANNNEITAMTLLRAFGACEMPFTRDRFKVYIADQIGVLTTVETKMAMIQQTFLAFMEGAIAISRSLVTADKTAFEPRAQPATVANLLEEMSAQLIRFSDKPDGTVSGKSFAGDQDDMAMSLMLAVYWRVCILASIRA
jgi:hypothetical protein